MKYTVAILVVSLGMASFSLGVTAPASADGESRYLLIASRSLPANLDALVASVGGQLITSFDQIGVAVVASSEPSFEFAASTLPGIQAVVADAETSLDLPVAVESAPLAEGEDVEVESNGSGPALADPQWNMRVIRVKDAWNAGALGAGVKVAVLDSGIDNRHQELVGKIDASRSRSFVNEPVPADAPAWVDRHAHGTHVAAIIAGKGVRVPGVAPQATLIAVKVLDRFGRGTTSGVIAGILHAADVGADIINMSLGFTFTVNGPGTAHLLEALNRAVNYAHARGSLVVASIGNGGSNLDFNRNAVKAPAQITHVVAVSATGPLLGIDSDTFASYSDYGLATVFVAAPGGNVQLSADNKVLNNPRTDWVLSACSSYGMCLNRTTVYLFMAGTSQAAPHVAGLAALIDGQYGGALSGAQLRAILQQHSDDLGRVGRDEFFGFGRINADRAVTRK